MQMHREMVGEEDEQESLPTMPEEIYEAELMPLFGGYSEYHNAPAEVVARHKIRLRAQREAEAEAYEKAQHNHGVEDTTHGRFGS